jgi:hypothetical protein
MIVVNQVTIGIDEEGVSLCVRLSIGAARTDRDMNFRHHRRRNSERGVVQRGEGFLRGEGRGFLDLLGPPLAVYNRSLPIGVGGNQTGVDCKLVGADLSPTKTPPDIGALIGTYAYPLRREQKEARLVAGFGKAENRCGLVVTDANVTVVSVAVGGHSRSLTYVNIVDVLLKAVSERDAKIEAAPALSIEGCNS